MTSPENEPLSEKDKASLPADQTVPAAGETPSPEAAEAKLKAAEPGSSTAESNTAAIVSDKKTDPHAAESASGSNEWAKVEASALEEAKDNASSSISTSNSDATESEKKDASSLTLTQHHVSHLLTDVLADPADSYSVMKKLRFPIILDCILTFGLLVAVGGFTVGLLEMFLIHSASQSISEQHYKAAIAILKGAPLPQVFARPGSDTEELLSKARYLDAMENIQNGEGVKDAIKELGEIRPQSRYFKLAQEAIDENTEPAPLLLQGGAETTETAPVEEKKPSLLEKALKEDEHVAR